MAKTFYKKITPSNRYLVMTPCDDEPEMLHIIKSGHKGLYFVVHDNAFQDGNFGKCEPMTAEMIYKKYSIDVKKLYPGKLDYNKWAAQERNGEKPDID